MSKTYLITNATGATETGDNEDRRLCKFEISGPEDMQVSDGFHTMDELYEHRIELFIALARICRRQELRIGEIPDQPFVWRSRAHDDGEGYMGWYLMGIRNFSGQQMTYHLPDRTWKDTEFARTLERAPKFDGHKPSDVLERLKTL